MDPKGISLASAVDYLGLTESLIPVGASNRPGGSFIKTSVTIHNTDNPGASAVNHARYLRGEEARRRSVSWHYTVDDREAIKHVPTTEEAWHSARQEGNRTSIGIEVCESPNVDMDIAWDNAALLAALVIRANKIPTDAVYPHQHWSGKHCPHKLLDNEDGWSMERFKTRVLRWIQRLELGEAKKEDVK